MLSNYRSVSNLTFLLKLAEKVVNVRLREHLAIHHLVPPFQSAYMPHHSIETALLRVFNDLLLTIDKGQGDLLVLLYLSAAFDTVDHDILIRRPENRFGLTGTALDWVRSYLSGRTQSVRVDSAISSPRSLAYGVPQGSVLGPVLFTLYTSPIHDTMHAHGVSDHEYADDTQEYLGFKLGDGGVDQSRAMAQMMQCVSEVHVWLRDNITTLTNLSACTCPHHITHQPNPSLSHLCLATRRSSHQDLPETWGCSSMSIFHGPACLRRSEEVVLSSSLRLQSPQVCQRCNFQFPGLCTGVSSH